MTIWLSLLALLVALVGGLAYAVVRGIALWRQLKRTGRAFGAEADRISQTTAQIEEQLARAGESSARLTQATARLRASRARLDVQLAAVREARATVRRLLWFMPGV